MIRHHSNTIELQKSYFNHSYSFSVPWEGMNCTIMIRYVTTVDKIVVIVLKFTENRPSASNADSLLIWWIRFFNSILPWSVPIGRYCLKLLALIAGLIGGRGRGSPSNGEFKLDIWKWNWHFWRIYVKVYISKLVI